MGSMQDVWVDQCRKVGCGCKAAEMSVRDKLRAGRERITRARVGVCLECVRSQGESRAEGLCGRWHTELG